MYKCDKITASILLALSISGTGFLATTPPTEATRNEKILTTLLKSRLGGGCECACSTRWLEFLASGDVGGRVFSPAAGWIVFFVQHYHSRRYARLRTGGAPPPRSLTLMSDI